MPKKILRRSRNPRNNLPLRTLQSDEPEIIPPKKTAETAPMSFLAILHQVTGNSRMGSEG